MKRRSDWLPPEGSTGPRGRDRRRDIVFGVAVAAGVAVFFAVFAVGFVWADRDYDAGVRRDAETSCAAVAAAGEVEGCVTVCGEVPDPADRAGCVAAFNGENG